MNSLVDPSNVDSQAAPSRRKPTFEEANCDIKARRVSRLAPMASHQSFRVESSHRNRSPETTPLSTRARNVLKFIGVKKLGDLNGLPHHRVLESKNCGLKTYEEIVRFAETLESPLGKGLAAHEGEGSSVSDRRLISIPPAARKWEVKRLPFSVRLNHALARIKVHKLGDLHGFSYDFLADLPDCGVRTVHEIRQFVDRVQRKKFGVSHEEAAQTSASFIISQFDAFLEQLPARKRDIFMDRVGAQKDPMTLMAVGRKHAMTRERVRQIVGLLTDQAFRFGGPPLFDAVQGLEVELNQNLWPLTPQLLELLVGMRRGPFRCALPFYIRLLGWMSPAISAWPVGQTPAAYRAPERERIISQIKQWFQKQRAPAKAVEVYRGVTGHDFRCSPFEFLETLRFAAEFAIQMDDPRNPIVHPPVEAPRRWSRQILSATDLSLLPREAVARAKALLCSRRSPSSRYRLAAASKF